MVTDDVNSMRLSFRGSDEPHHEHVCIGCKKVFVHPSWCCERVPAFARHPVGPCCWITMNMSLLDYIDERVEEPC